MLQNIAQYGLSLFSRRLQDQAQNAIKKARNTRQRLNIYCIELTIATTGCMAGYE